jgi:hypothetical protein
VITAAAAAAARARASLSLIIIILITVRQAGTDLLLSAQSSQQDDFFNLAQWCRSIYPSFTATTSSNLSVDWDVIGVLPINRLQNMQEGKQHKCVGM